MIAVLAVCSILLIAAELTISQGVSTQYAKLMQSQREDSVRKMAIMAYHTITPVLDKLKVGTLSKEEARAQITGLVRGMTYDDEYGRNYIFMSSYEGTMLVQPFDPGKEGSNQWDLKDSNGIYIIRELVNAAKNKPEGAFVTYHYYVPTKERIEEKLSYVIGVPEIDAYIGTGMYLDSNYAELQKIFLYQRVGFLTVSLLILGLAVLYIKALYRANQGLAREITEREYAEGNMRTVFDSIHDAILIHDYDGKMLLANKGAAVMYGIPADQILNYSIQDISSDGGSVSELINGTEFLDHSSLLFEWKGKRPLDSTEFDAEVALRKTKWSGQNVVVAVVRDICERKKHEAEIRHLAYNDYLTSLPNRIFVLNELKRELEKAAEDGSSGAIIFIDLDDFKKINDTFGHFFGDEVLKILAGRLHGLISGEYLPSRIGGDEFVILCRNTGLQQAARIAEEVLKLFRTPIELNGSSVTMTCSLGIACYPKDGSSVEDIFKNADLALYSAKDQGKNSYAFYRDAMSAELQYKSELEEQLRNAYQNREFVLYYQPLLDVRQNKIVGCEALIRWNSPRFGLVMPDRIIPLAEESGLIDRIGSWVIDTAFAFAKSLSEQGIYVSCNVSPAQLAQKNFVEDVIEKFEKYGLDHGAAVLEITESCLIESFDSVSHKLSMLRKKGIRVYLDDFGTGYSSLNYLKNLPVDCIKIDRSFIEEVSKGGVESKIMKTIITLAHDLELLTVAEGVETEEQLEFLAQCECDLVQGYLISRPQPEHEVEWTYGV